MPKSIFQTKTLGTLFLAGSAILSGCGKPSMDTIMALEKTTTEVEGRIKEYKQSRQEIEDIKNKIKSKIKIIRDYQELISWEPKTFEEKWERGLKLIEQTPDYYKALQGD